MAARNAPQPAVTPTQSFFDVYDQYCSGTESPLAYHRWSAISTVASIIGRKLWLDFGFYRIYPNMMITLVGPPALKKTTAMSTARRVARELGLVNYSGDTVTQPKMVEDIHETQAEVVLPNNTTYKHSSYTIQLTELSLLLKANDENFPPFLIKMFDCDEDPYQYRTKNKNSYRLENYCINLLAGTTPQSIPMIFNEQMIGTGLTSRMIFVYADERQEMVPFPVFTDANRRALEDLKHRSCKIASLCGPASFSLDARDAYETWYVSRDQNTDDTSKAASYWSRKDVHVQKLMLVSAAARGSMVLEVSDLEWALGELDAIEPGMSFALAAVGSNKQNLPMQQVIYMLRKARDAGCTIESLRAATLNSLEHRQFVDMMQSLLEAGRIYSENVNGTSIWKLSRNNKHKKG